MKRLSTSLIICLSLVPMLNNGCTYYVSKKYPTCGYKELQPAEKKPLLLHFEYRTNGKYNKSFTKSHKVKFMLILQESGLFSSVKFVDGPNTSSTPRMDIVFNEKLDQGKTFVKGLITGLTFFILGSNVTSNYEFEGTYTQTGMTPVSFDYNHALSLNMGLIVPKQDGIVRDYSDEAVDHIAMDLTVHLLKDLQHAGYL